jgi:cell division protein YceG involved in septum cleavage
MEKKTISKTMQNSNQRNPTNSNITTFILTLITIALIVIVIILSSGPRKVEKYMNRIYKLQEQFKIEDNEGRKKVAKKLESAWITLAKNIQHNLTRIMKRNKTVNGDPIIEDHDEWKDGIERLKVTVLGETTISEGTHTINKKYLHMCDVNHPDDNTLAHVLIHEYAHVINSTIGHDEKWTRLFDIIQDVAHKEGWFDRHKKVELSTYCGGRYMG